MCVGQAGRSEHRGGRVLFATLVSKATHAVCVLGETLPIGMKVAGFPFLRLVCIEYFVPLSKAVALSVYT